MNETLITIFTDVVALSTLLYMFITGWLAWETRRVRQAQTQPRVSVQLELNQTGIKGYDLVIRNEGQGPARNVRFEFQGDSSYFRNNIFGATPPPIDQLPAIEEGLAYMGAGQTLRFTVGIASTKEFDRACLVVQQL